MNEWCCYTVLLTRILPTSNGSTKRPYIRSCTLMLTLRVTRDGKISNNNIIHSFMMLMYVGVGQRGKHEAQNHIMERTSSELQNFSTFWHTNTKESNPCQQSSCCLQYISTPPTNSTVHSQMKEIHILYTRESNHHPTHKMSKQKIRVHTHRASPHIENYRTSNKLTHI